MRWIFIKTCLLLTVLVFLCDISNAKRSGGRARTSGSSWGLWGKKKTSGSSSGQSNRPATHAAPSAPVESQFSKKQTSQNQHQSSSQQKPIGWNVPGQQNKQSPTANTQTNPIWKTPETNRNTQQNSGWANKYQNSPPKNNEGVLKKETSKVQQSSPNQPQPPQPGWNVQNGQHGTAGSKSGYQTNSAPPAYNHHNAAPPGYNGQPTWGAPPAYQGHGAPGYGGYSGFGHGQGQAAGGYGGGYAGYGGHGGYGGYGGHGGYGGGYPQQSFGGYNPGYGGMSLGGGHGGGFGSPGGFGGGYNPMQKKNSFFSASTIGSVVAGMLVYNMASSLISHGLGSKRPYNVVNYYNQAPNTTVPEIKLPSNVLTLCEGDINSVCGQGTQSVCTQNGTVLCVATLNNASPCDQNGNKALCVNTTVKCADANDPLCQNSTHKDKLQADVNVPCFTNLTLDVNLIDKDQTAPNTKYTYCVTSMAVAGPEYKLCEELKNTNDYRSVLNGEHEWFLETDGFMRNYSIFTFDRPMESNGQINMPVTVLLKCSDNAMKLCPPGTIATCTTFNEVMCMAALEDVQSCTEKNSTCAKSQISCPDDSKDSFCKNKPEGSQQTTVEVPCFANITLNAPFPKFTLADFNGTLPDLTATSSYTYNFNYCVTTLALPGTDFDLCITKEAKYKQDKEKKT